MPLSLDPAMLSAVIATVYDAAIDPTKWTLALKRSCEFVGGAQSVMFWQGASIEEIDALYYYNDDPHFTRLYLERLASFNPLFPAVLFQEVGAVVTAYDLVPADEMNRTRFHREWLAPQRLTDSLCVVLERDAARIAMLSYPWRGEAIDETARQKLALLVPHFQRAVAIGRLFARQKETESAFTATLDHVDDGVLLLDADGRIVFANGRGKTMLEQGTLLRASNGLLRATLLAADRALRENLGALADAGAPIASGGLTITLSDPPGSRWIANVLPLSDSARRGVGIAHAAAAAVFVRSATFVDPTPLETLARDHRLTASEIRVVEALLRVSGIKAIAEMLGISDATVKTHLNRIYRKCGAKNQSDLIKLVAGIGR